MDVDETDILADWKNNRFIRVIYDESNVMCLHLIVLTDIGFWAENADNLKSWCEEYGCEQVGMTVEIPTDELYTLFCLRWN